MAVPLQPDAQTAEAMNNASLEAEDCLEIIDLVTDFDPNCFADLASYPTPEYTQNSFQEELQHTKYGSVKFTRDPLMSFRDRHRLLDEIYSSYPDPSRVIAEEMSEIALKVGLFMEEVLAWFKDEKSRRADFANNRTQKQVPTCQFPPSPQSTKALGEISSAASSYNSTSPATLSLPLDVPPPRSVHSEDEKMLTPPKPKRGRPPKAHIKAESDNSSPDSKRRKISMKYPCVDCRNFASSERYAEHINRTHFPENVWECPKNNPKTGKPCMNLTTNPNYRPFYRIDNFANHLRAEHNCSNSEVDELKNTCKFEVFGFFHKICGFCDKALESRDESIKHIKEHFRYASEQPQPPTDLGVSQWKEKCGSEHKLQIGVHYRRSQASIPDLMNVDHDHDHDDHDGENDGHGDGPGERDSDGSNNDGSNYPSNSTPHDRGNDMGGHSGKECSDSETHDSQDESDDHNHSHSCERNEGRPSGENCSDLSSYKHSLDASSYQCQKSPPTWPKIEYSEWEDLPSISSLPIPVYDKRQENSEYTATRYESHDQQTGLSTIARTRQPRKLTNKEDANFQCHVKGCGKLFGRSYNFKAHMETHDASREYPFPCPLKDCNKKFVRKTDLQRHHQSVHMKQRNHRCDYCSRYFARKNTLTRHMLDGCSKRFGEENHGKIPVHEHTHNMLSPNADDASTGLSTYPIIMGNDDFPEVYSFTPFNIGELSYVAKPSDGCSDLKAHMLGRCTYPECGKIFKDLKAHMLGHQNHRPEKCPIPTCEYHTKGFARKYDKNRHTLTHYKGTMVCGFCPGSGSTAEKSFNRADVFKRHLTSFHGVEQTPPSSRKIASATGNDNNTKNSSKYGIDTTGKCSTCSQTFNNAQKFYDHLDDCVLRVVQQEDPSEAINAARLAEVENDQSVHDILRINGLPIVVDSTGMETKTNAGKMSQPTPPRARPCHVEITSKVIKDLAPSQLTGVGTH